MRRRSIFALLVVSAVAACTSKNNPPPPPPGYGPVRIAIACSPYGTLGAFSNSSWSARLPDEHAAYRFFNDGDIDIAITPQDTTYPFGHRPLNAGRRSYVDGKPVSGTPANTYKYSISVSCPVSGGPAVTRTIDPDMIIPWKIQ
jgi:hypothetical protein